MFSVGSGLSTAHMLRPLLCQSSPSYRPSQSQISASCSLKAGGRVAAKWPTQSSWTDFSSPLWTRPDKRSPSGVFWATLFGNRPLLQGVQITNSFPLLMVVTGKSQGKWTTVIRVMLSTLLAGQTSFTWPAFGLTPGRAVSGWSVLLWPLGCCLWDADKVALILPWWRAVLRI